MYTNNLNKLPDDDMINSSNSRSGLAIGIITRGWSSIKWMQHMQKLYKHTPVGMYWKEFVVEGLPWAEARTEIVHKARKENFEWLLFTDDDVFIPMDTINKLLSSKKKIINGVYWTKSESSRPVIFKRMGEGPWDDFPLNEIVEIEGSGLGCALIHMSVFDKFDEAKIPYFLENWVITDKERKLHSPIGEDHYFFHKARELGYKVYADTSILCDHYDYKTKRFFPGEKIVREVSERVLKEEGREDIIKNNNEGLGMDSNKQTIVFYNPTNTYFCGDSIEKKGVGGAETSIINMAKIFARAFNTHVYSVCDYGIYDDVVYHDIRTTSLDDIRTLNPDVIVVSRIPKVLKDFKDMGAKILLWAHDKVEDPVWDGIEENSNNYDMILAISRWHKQRIQEKFNIPNEKIYITRNGADPDLFKKDVKKVKGRCIYTSTPFRGLDVLLNVWPKIKERVPHATLEVYSSMKVYGANHNDGQFEHLYEKARKLDGVTYYGTVTQPVLAKAIQEAEVLAYPNTFEETSCITAMEAQTAKTIIVSTKKGALPETVKEDCGILIDGNPHTEEYQDEFVHEVVELLLNDVKLKTMQDACEKYDFSWDLVAGFWRSTFFTYEKATNEVVNTPEYWNAIYKQEKTKGWIRQDSSLYKLLIQEIKQGDKVLDVGCGTGEFTRHIREVYSSCEIWGTDVSLEAIDFCRESDRSIYYANHPIENTENFEPNYYDVITILHTLEHFEDVSVPIKKMKHLLKKNGKIIIVLPINDDEWHEHFKIWQMKDIFDMISEYFPKEEIRVNHREVKEKRYQSGRYFEEAIIIIKFKEDE